MYLNISYKFTKDLLLARAEGEVNCSKRPLFTLFSVAITKEKASSFYFSNFNLGDEMFLCLTQLNAYQQSLTHPEARVVSAWQYPFMRYFSYL